MKQNRIFILLIVAVVIAGSYALFYAFNTSAPPEQSAGSRLPEGFVMPALTDIEIEGSELFANNCQACHGLAATGTEQGPPLVHKIYEPNHHGDASFYRAVSNGTIRHHWQFGDMPPVEGVTEAEVAQIIAYVRKLQSANGVF